MGSFKKEIENLEAGISDVFTSTEGGDTADLEAMVKLARMKEQISMNSGITLYTPGTKSGFVVASGCGSSPSPKPPSPKPPSSGCGS